jgi:hypothetical protein
VCYFCTISWLEMVNLIVFGLSKRRKNGEQQAPRVGDEGYWNGWNADLIRRVNGADRFDIALDQMHVTTSFKGRDFAAETRWARSEIDTYEKMPLLFEDRPSGRPKCRYANCTVEITGRDTRFGLRCQIDIHTVSPDRVVETEAAGSIVLSATDWIGAEMDKAREFSTPCIEVVLYDLEGSLFEALRAAFVASQARVGEPTLRLFLSSKIDVPIQGFGQAEDARRVPVRDVIVWETWSSPKAGL